MEAASAIFYGDNSVTGDRSKRWRNVVIHEIAHQWFGNAVTEYDWDDVWLSEGFATFFTLLFREHAYGHDVYIEGLQQARDRVHSYYEEHPNYRIVHDNLSDMSQVSSSHTYQKGAWTLHMLRMRIGEEAFRNGIQTYYGTYFNGSASTKDFQRIMEEASGQDLEDFFQQWLYQGGFPVLDVSWSYDEADKTLSVTIDQVQSDGFAFEIPVELGINSGESATPRIETVVSSTGSTATVTVQLEQRPDHVVVDPRTRLLARWNVSAQK
jgi:aminopeptidase N